MVLRLRNFFLGVGGFSALLAAVTAVAVYLFAPASEVATAAHPVWKTAKYLVLDIHVLLVFLAAAGLLLWGLLWVITRGGSLSLRWHLYSVAAGVLAVLVAVHVAVQYHPVFIKAIRVTPHPSSEVPDQVVLTWAGDPATSLSVQWRTTAGVPDGKVRYRPAGESIAWSQTAAESRYFTVDNLHNDHRILWHTARLADLVPGTVYEYQVGYPGGWIERRTFTTAPVTPAAFSFLYLGDSQQTPVDGGLHRDTGAAFVLHAGDLVNRGCDRDDWDTFFFVMRNIMDRMPFMATIGNHDDCDDFDPRLYTLYFDLPDNGSPALPTEQSYHFTYGNLLVVSLNSNIKIREQEQWLEQVLGESDAQWKILLWHHPAFSSRAVRDNRDVRSHWGRIAEQHGVDIVFQGHDHAYARSHPLSSSTIADGDKGSGVIYVISVFGAKYYGQDQNSLFEVGYENMSTYQVISIDGGELRYQAYDVNGNLVDEFILTK